MQKGFTLIELLVVVLIIGILSSVALPQYQKSVDKSRAASIWPLLKTNRQAMDSCLLASGKSSCANDELDIELPQKDCEFSFNRGTCDFMIGALTANNGRAVMWGSYSDRFALGIGDDGKRFCVGEPEDCKVLGFTVAHEDYPYGSWGTEYTEN